jgi:hypothetical protein
LRQPQRLLRPCLASCDGKLHLQLPPQTIAADNAVLIALEKSS